MELLKNIRHMFYYKRARPGLPFQVSVKNLCLPAHFKERLLIEKQRAARINCGFSIIIFDLKDYLNGANIHHRLLPMKMDYLLRTIGKQIRETDLVCQHRKHFILTLLPDTDNQGAQSVCERLIQHLVWLQRKYFNIEANPCENIKIKLLSYPNRRYKQGRKNSPGKGSTGDDKGQHKSNHDADQQANSISLQPSAAANFKINYMEPLNLCVCTFNGSSIALPIFDIFFLDQKIVANFFTVLQRISKRLIDIVGSVLGLILFSPLMLFIAVLIKTKSHGPALFKQRRLGFRGKYFTFIKFRSMYCNCKDQIHQEYVTNLIRGKNEKINNGSTNNPFYKITNDPRITPLGKFIRKTSIDELPQFWNVLKGEMSLVGPRPPIPYEVSEYENWHLRRFWNVKPGMTGLSQIKGRNRIAFDDSVRFDIYYADNWSFLMDLKILVKTIGVVFDGK